MEGNSRRNPSLDTTNVAQVYTLPIKVTLQKVLAIEICLMNIRERKKLKISKEKLLLPH